MAKIALSASGGKLDAQGASGGKLDAQGASGGKLDAQGASGGKLDAQGASGGKLDAQGASGGKLDAQGASGGKLDAQGASGGKLDAQGASGGKLDAQGASGGKLDAQGASGGKLDAQGASGGKLDAQGASGGASGPTPEKLPFDEAIEFFRNKINLPTEDWRAIERGEHAPAFVVAGAMKEDLLCDFRAALDRGIAGGTTLQAFRKAFDAIVQKYGWSYRGGRNWRTRVIYNTNLDQAYMAGKWDKIKRLQDRLPYLRYVHGASTDPRPEHLAWHGLVLPVEADFWKTHYPKNGWGCTCTVMQVGPSDLDRYGWSLSPEPAIEIDPKTNAPKGIDPGFAYNVGIASLGKRLSDRALQAFEQEQAAAKARGGQKSGWTKLTQGDWQTCGRPDNIAPRKTKAEIHPSIPANATEAVKLVEQAFGGAETLVTGKGGQHLLINAESLGKHFDDHKDYARARYIPLLPEILTDPDEVWQSFEQSGKTGKIVIRHYYIRMLALAKSRQVAFVLQAGRGFLQGWTILEKEGARDLNKLRRGKLIYGKEETP